MERQIRHQQRPTQVAITIDVEWAHPTVLADVLTLLDERGLQATFFCTHADISVPGHERAVHPNFRRHGNTLLERVSMADQTAWTDQQFYRFVLSSTKSFCPEATGVRSHSLFYDSQLLPLYQDAGLRYDSSYFLPFMKNAAPVYKGCGIFSLPTYYMDYWDLTEKASGFRVEGLGLPEDGLKILDFHPNLVFINAANKSDYLDSKKYYHEPEQLLKLRHKGRGARSLFLDLLDYLAKGQFLVTTLNAVRAQCRIPERP